MGVCLGHQTMGEAFGGNVVRAQTMMHGKVSPVSTTAQACLKTCPIRSTAHATTAWPSTAPPCPTASKLPHGRKTAKSMGVRHKEYAIEGVQFHPEALLTEHGHDMLKNFLEEFKDYRPQKS